MGAIADGFAAYARPLFEETDGSIDKMNHAMTIAQMCWNLASCQKTSGRQQSPR